MPRYTCGLKALCFQVVCSFVCVCKVFLVRWDIFGTKNHICTKFFDDEEKWYVIELIRFCCLGVKGPGYDRTTHGQKCSFRATTLFQMCREWFFVSQNDVSRGLFSISENLTFKGHVQIWGKKPVVFGPSLWLIQNNGRPHLHNQLAGGSRKPSGPFLLPHLVVVSSMPLACKCGHVLLLKIICDHSCTLLWPSMILLKVPFKEMISL